MLAFCVFSNKEPCRHDFISQERVDLRFPILAKTTLSDFQTQLSIGYVCSFLKNSNARVLMNYLRGWGLQTLFSAKPLTSSSSSLSDLHCQFSSPMNRSDAKLFPAQWLTGA